MQQLNFQRMVHKELSTEGESQQKPTSPRETEMQRVSSESDQQTQEMGIREQEEQRS